jgi:hypothetical protein
MHVFNKRQQHITFKNYISTFGAIHTTQCSVRKTSAVLIFSIESPLNVSIIRDSHSFYTVASLIDTV